MKTRQEFISLLDEEGYPYHWDDEKLVIGGDLRIELETVPLPENLPIVFQNISFVDLDFAKIRSELTFKNGGAVFLRSSRINANLFFENEGVVKLQDATINKYLDFRNKGDVSLALADIKAADCFFQNLGGVNLTGTKTPHEDNAGEWERELHPYYHEERGFLIMLGCWNGTEQEAIQAIGKRYPDSDVREGYIQKIKSAFQKERAINNTLKNPQTA